MDLPMIKDYFNENEAVTIIAGKLAIAIGAKKIDYGELGKLQTEDRE